MERIVLTTEQQATADDFKDTYPYFDPDGNIYTGSNLVVDDDLRIDNSWEGVVLGGEGGCVWFYVPAWELILPIDLIDYVTDRAGPDGQTMPIFDPLEVTPLCEPSVAAAMARHTQNRRPFMEVLRDATRRLSPREEHHALTVLHKVIDCSPKPHRPRHPHKRH